MRALLATITIALLVPVVPAVAAPPDNDNYQAAVGINSPGVQMPRDTITTPVVNTAEATMQADILAPPAAGGPPEPSECTPDATTIGHTVWYRFFPDINGRIAIKALGFDSVVAVLPFESVENPLPQGYTCSNKRDDITESLEVPVERGVGYAVQVGGAGAATGNLQVEFTFLPDRDGDGRSDEDDECPTRRGTVAGCPPRTTAAFPYTWSRVTGGIQLVKMAVKSIPSGSRISVRCSRGCASQRIRARRSRVTLKRLLRRRFTPGTRIEIRVTQAGYFGDYFRLNVSKSGVTSTKLCLNPGSNKPRKRCQ